MRSALYFRKVWLGASTMALATALTCSATIAQGTGERSVKRKPAPQSQSVSARKPDGPAIIIASINKQRIRLFDRNGEISNARISSGRPGFDTPTGVFSIIQKNQHHVSNIYGAAMPFMQRLTWSGIAMHAGDLPGYRASHGCVRLPYSYARTLFSQTEMGARVIVTRDETSPVPFSHPNLFRPLPADIPEAQMVASVPINRETKVASASAQDSFDTQATLSNLVNLPRYFWFTPALAEAVANLPPEQRPPQTRSEVDKFVSDQLARLQQDVDATRSARAKAEAGALEAGREAKAVRAELIKAHKAIEKSQREIAALEARSMAALAGFEAFMHDTFEQGSQDDADRDGIEAREADFEDEILELSHQREAAQAEIATLEDEIDRLQTALTRAEDSAASERRQAQQADRDIKIATTALEAAKKEAARRTKPVSVLVSLKNMRVYVRQGFEPIIDASIEVNGTPRRFGTHVFTAMSYDPNDADQFEWQLVTAQAPTLLGNEGRADRKGKSDRMKNLSGEMQAQFAAAALESFTIPEEVRNVITDLARPGASLIVTDQILPAHENGKGTEFVLLTK